MAGLIRYVATMDNRSFVRGASQNAAAASKSSRVIRGENKETEASFTALRKSTSRTRELMSGFAGVVGVGGLAFGLKDAVVGGEKLQASQAQLQRAIKATGDQSKSTFAELNDAAERLSTHGGLTVPENLQALTAFTNETHSAKSAIKDLALTTNIARGTTLGFSGAQRVVQMALTGSVGRLQRLLGPIIANKDATFKLTQAHVREINALRDVAQGAGKGSSAWLRYQEAIHALTPQQRALATMQDKHATSVEVLADATKVFAGQTTTYMRTTQGRTSDLQHSFSNLTDQLGEGLLPVVNAGLAVFGGFVGLLVHNKAILYGLIGAVTAVTGVLAVHAAIVELAKTKTILLTASNRLLGTSFTDAKGQVLGMGQGVKTSTAALTENTATTVENASAKDGDTAATLALSGAQDEATASSIAMSVAMRAIPLLALIGLVTLAVTHWQLFAHVGVAAWHWVEGAAVSVFDWIKGNWPLIAGILLGPIAFGIAEGIKHFHAIEGFVSGVVKSLGNVWHTLEGILVTPFTWAWNRIKAIGHGISHLFGSIVHGAGSILHTATFGLFSSGGPVGSVKYLASGGPSGTDTVPAFLTPGEYVLNQAVTQQIGVPTLNAINAGHLGSLSGHGMTITPGDVYLKLDSRVIAHSVVNYTLRRAARGPNGMIGGGLATGITSSTQPIVNA